MPHKIIVLFDIDLSSFDEKNATNKTVTRPKIKPVNGSVNPPNKANENPLIMIIPAPREAPEETPKIKGEASGFLKMDWQTAPAIARLPPTINASSTLGRRNSHTIETFLGSISGGKSSPKILCKIIKNVSPRLMLTLPRETAITITRREVIATMTRYVFFFMYLTV
jgi:hypothetical protein